MVEWGRKWDVTKQKVVSGGLLLMPASQLQDATIEDDAARHGVPMTTLSTSEKIGRHRTFFSETGVG